jgi:peptidoglycan/LPS O-acetylase OafA/YrhL
VAVTGAVAAALLIWFHRIPTRPNSPDWFQGQPYQYPFFALVIAVTLVGLAHSRVVGRIADNRFSRYTATVSFGLYVWHFLVIHLFSYITAGRLNAGTLSPGEHLAVAGALFVVSYAVATISWRFLEQPALRSGWATRA